MNRKPIPLISLADRLRERISHEGPLSFHDWMKAALYDEHEGYYCRPDRVRWGRAGDYRTGPERTDLYGATFARYFAKLYEDAGWESTLTIIEVGGGAGHFASAVLKSLHRNAPCLYYFDELAGDTQKRAQERLKAFADRIHFEPLVVLDPIDPGIVFANELLDAFPVHRVTLRGGKLRELYVIRGDHGGFQWSVGALSTSRLSEFLEQAKIALTDDQIIEINLDLEDWFRQVAEKLARGYVILVDYGANAGDLYRSSNRFKGTLRGFRDHELAEDLLAHPGEQDITSTISWDAVRRVSAGLSFDVVEFQRLDRFLLQAGLLEELAERVAKTANEATRAELTAGAREMILPDGMAASFQVMVLKKGIATRTQ